MKNKEELYEAFLKSGGVHLTTKELNALGISSSEITNLIKQRMINREKRGIYTLDSLDEVIYYAVSLFKQDKEKAVRLIDMCYAIDSTNPTVALQKMREYLYHENYEKAYEIFDHLYTAKVFSREDTMLFLYLFHYLMDLSDNDKTAVEYLQKEDIMVISDEKETFLENEIRNSIFQDKFTYALQKSKEKKNSVKDKVIMNLVSILASKRDEKRKTVHALIIEQKYEEAKDFLMNKFQFKLENHEKVLLKMLEDRLELEKGNIPQLTTIKTERFYEAIMNNNYHLAKELIQKKQLTQENLPLQILIEDILVQINQVQPVQFSNIIESLMQKNIKEALSLLDRYLQKNKKEKYKDLLIHYIKVSVLEQDLAFTKPMMLLSQLDEKYTFDLSNTLQDFYKSLSMNNKILSKVYLDIIKDANELGLCNMNLDNLYIAVNHVDENNIKDEVLQLINEVNEWTGITDKEKILVKEQKTNNQGTFDKTLESIYDLILDNQKLTEKSLMNLGLSKEEINDLVNNQVLRRKRRYEYEIVSVEDYGAYLYKNEEYDKLNQFNIKKFEQNKEQLDYSLDAIRSSLDVQELDKSYDFFKAIKGKDILPRPIENRLFYLFSYFIPLDKNEQNRLNDLTENDFMFEIPSVDENFSVSFENKITEYILSERYLNADQLLKRNHAYSAKSTTIAKITRSLMHQAMLVREKRISEVKELVDKKDYEQVVNKIELLPVRTTQYERNIVTLLLDYMKIKETKEIPISDLDSSNFIFEYIEHKNYQNALRLLNVRFNRSTTDIQKNKYDIFKTILTDVLDLINDIKEETNQQEESVNIDQLVPLLNSENIYDALFMINTYLKTINKDNYRDLILDLLKLDVLERDVSFQKTMQELSMMNDTNYIFDIERILPSFYDSLNEGKYKVSRIYLDIIEKFSEYKEDKEFIQNLTTIVDNAENSSDIAVDYQINSNYLELFKDVELSDKVITNKQSLKTNRKEQELDYDRMKKFLLEQKEELIENDGVILLDKKYTIYKPFISKVVKDIEGIGAFFYGSRKEERIILKNKKKNTNTINCKELAQQIKEEYNNRNYEKTIALSHELLDLSTIIHPGVLYKLAMSYSKKSRLDKAIRLLQIADDITYACNYDYHYTEFIDRFMKEKINQADAKTKPSIELSEFNQDQNTYGIENLEEISNTIIQLDYNVDEACKRLGFDQEKTNIVKLICARDAFADDNFELGNKFLKRVEQSENKSKQVKELLLEITQNKKFYKNRLKESEKQMLLKQRIVGNNS